MSKNQNTHFRDYSWRSLVLTHDPDHDKSDEIVYKFCKGEKVFKTTDHTLSGVYGEEHILLEDEGDLLLQDGDMIEFEDYT